MSDDDLTASALPLASGLDEIDPLDLVHRIRTAYVEDGAPYGDGDAAVGRWLSERLATLSDALGRCLEAGAACPGGNDDMGKARVTDRGHV